MMSLVSLGSNQVSKSCNDAKLIEAHHLDKHHDVDGQALRSSLLLLHTMEAEHVLIFLNA